ncbi:glycosyltransferase [Flammeovirgaceae bacterium SG7u.111]|nr:glycosyltransferase [Flammeovirgaceae bacterium SG7u.132]WPO35466.1 glycosyltransferase [Flammeovirgaceae bacterium SG7u.111]
MEEKKIKILRVIARLNIGGPAIHTVLLTSALNNDNFSTKLVAGNISSNEGDMSYLADQKQVSVQYIPHLQREISPAKDFKTALSLWKIIKDYRPNIIHTHTAKAGLVGRACALLFNMVYRTDIKVVHTFHGHVFHSYFSPLKTKFFILLERALAEFSDLIITITPKQQEEILSLKVGKRLKNKVIPLGLDLDKFYYFNKNSNFIYQQFRIDPSKKLIGIVARFVPIKNITLFLKIARSLLNKRDDIHFVLVGDGEERELLESSCKKLNIEEHVTFTGFVNDLPKIYADFYLTLLTSNNEGSPVSIIESMTSGTPVVASNVGGVPDLYKEEAKWMLCEPDKVDDFVKATEKLLDHPELANEIGELHKHDTYNKYSFYRLVNDLTLEYNKLVS